MELKIQKAVGELKNVNLRTENNGDERILAVDLKIRANVAREECGALFEDTPDMLATIYDKGGNVLNPVIEILYRVPTENVEVTIDDLAAYKGGRIKKNVRLVPRSGDRMEVTMTIQLSGVPDVRALAKRLNEEVKITIIERQQSLGLQSVA